MDVVNNFAFEQERKKEVELKAKKLAEIEHRRVWGWRDDGKKTFQNLNNAFIGVRDILVPHQSKKNAMLELITICQKAHDNKINGCRLTPWRLLNEINPFCAQFRLKRRVIHRKYIVMEEMRRIQRLKQTLLMPFSQSPSSESLTPLLIEHLALVYMENAYGRRVPVGRSKVMYLRMLRTRTEEARVRFVQTQASIEKMASMLVCMSVYHERAAGCLKCGAIVFHGQLMVNSIQRETGAVVLVHHQFELDVSYFVYRRIYIVYLTNIN